MGRKAGGAVSSRLPAPHLIAGLDAVLDPAVMNIIMCVTLGLIIQSVVLFVKERYGRPSAYF